MTCVIFGLTIPQTSWAPAATVSAGHLLLYGSLGGAGALRCGGMGGQEDKMKAVEGTTGRIDTRQHTACGQASRRSGRRRVPQQLQADTELVHAHFDDL